MVELFDVGVVDRVGIADDRHGGVIEQRIAVQHEQLVIGQFGEGLGGMPGDLTGGVGIAELIGIRPDDRGQSGTGLVIGGQVERE